jgi:hypothetical protein
MIVLRAELASADAQGLGELAVGGFAEVRIPGRERRASQTGGEPEKRARLTIEARVALMRADRRGVEAGGSTQTIAHGLHVGCGTAGSPSNCCPLEGFALHALAPFGSAILMGAPGDGYVSRPSGRGGSTTCELRSRVSPPRPGHGSGARYQPGRTASQSIARRPRVHGPARSGESSGGRSLDGRPGGQGSLGRGSALSIPSCVVAHAAPHRCHLDRATG